MKKLVISGWNLRRLEVSKLGDHRFVGKDHGVGVVAVKEDQYLRALVALGEGGREAEAIK